MVSVGGRLRLRRRRRRSRHLTAWSLLNIFYWLHYTGSYNNVCLISRYITLSMCIRCGGVEEVLQILLFYFCENENISWTLYHFCYHTIIYTTILYNIHYIITITTGYNSLTAFIVTTWWEMSNIMWIQ